MAGNYETPDILVLTSLNPINNPLVFEELGLMALIPCVSVASKATFMGFSPFVMFCVCFVCIPLSFNLLELKLES